MARERQLEGGGEGDDTMHFSDAELDDDGNPIEDDENEEGEEGEEEEEGEEGEDRGDDVDDPLAEDDGADVEALRAVAGARTVPVARLNQVLEENRRMRDIIEQAAVGVRTVPAQVPKVDEPPAFDLKGKLKERAEAQLEGDVDKIVALDLEIEEHRNTVVRAQGEQAGRQAAGGAIEADRLASIVNAAFERYPFLNSDNADVFNPEALGDVMMYRDRYINNDGLTKPEALKKAINRVCPHYVEAAGEEGDEGDERPRRKVKGVGGDPNARSAKTIIRNAKAGARLPPRIAGNGTGGAAANRTRGERRASEIQSGEYEQLPESEKARLRGDFVTG